MQSVCTTSGITTTCSYTGTSTIAFDGLDSTPVVVYDPFLDVFIGVSLWLIVVFSLVYLIKKFR